MHSSRLSPLSAFLLSAAVVLPIAAVAAQFDPASLPYSDDRSWSLPLSVDVAYLTDAGVVGGYPDGTFRAGALVNRAEFTHMAMKLSAMSYPKPAGDRCFPDVLIHEWYAPAVCGAKAFGYVNGYPRPGAAMPEWRFEPGAAVRYAEGLKILSEIYGLPVTGDDAGIWYQPFVDFAQRNDLALSGVQPGDLLNRGDVARLIASVRAFQLGDLAALRDAERGRVRSSVSSSSSRSSARSSSRSSATSRSSSSSSKTSSASSRSSSSVSSSDLGNDNADSAIRSDILVLGERAGPLGAVTFFSYLEPLQVDDIVIGLEHLSPSVESFRVYVDDDDRELGRATRDDNGSSYTLHVRDGDLILPYRTELTVSFRAELASHDEGGLSGEDVRISTIQMSGVGQWSNDDYHHTANDTHPAFQTARAEITSIVNAGDAQGLISGGADKQVAQFRFSGRRADALADLRLTDLTFQIEGAGVTLSDVYLLPEGETTMHACTVSGTRVLCTGLGETHGSLRSGSKLLRVYADVALTPGVSNPSFALTLNRPGSPTEAGDVHWTDGDTVFDWLPLDQPVARGTLWK